MKRWFLCDVIGDPNTTDPTQARRPVLADYVSSFSAVYSASGTSALVLVAARNMAPLLSLPGVDPLPDVPLDVRIGSMHGPAKAAMRGAMTRRGFAAVPDDNSSGYRDVIRGIGQLLDPGFNENAVDVVEP